MRLLNAHTLKIHTFFGDIPPYAILSHVWASEEVTYQDFQSGKATSLKGYDKILGCCRQVIADSLEYVWIDTCCIDKSSSSELQEAINSMFNFYRDAAVCYAYLRDVYDNKDSQLAKTQYASNRALSLNSAFSRSRWFTRGWTLQELLAPSLLEFYAADWTPLGTRDDLRKTVAIITKIDHDFFIYGKFSDYSIAQKFSWASGRQTTRVEDEAYCLLGLFGVSMPLLYGEGRRAFRRLQEELMRVSDDQSIFAWSSIATGKSSTDHRTESGLFASSPSSFASSGDIVRGQSDYSSPPYSITNKGISIYLPLIEPDSGYAIPYGGSTSASSAVSIALTPTGSLAILNCRSKSSGSSQLAIVIEQTNENTRYTRTNPSLGLLSIPLADIRAKARQKNVLIQAHNLDNEGVGWTSQKQGQLVILTNLPAHNGITLKDHSPGLVCHCLTNGVISFRMPVDKSTSEYNRTSGTVYLNIQHEQGRIFTIVIAPRGSGGRRGFTATFEASWKKFMLDTEKGSTTKTSPIGMKVGEDKEQEDYADMGEVTIPLTSNQLHHAFKIAMPQWDAFIEHVKAELQSIRFGVADNLQIGNVTRHVDQVRLEMKTNDILGRKEGQIPRIFVSSFES